MSYLLDANVFLQAKNLHYGFDFCPGFWDWLREANQRGIVFSIEKVEAELVDADAATWAAACPLGFFLKPDNDVALALATVSNWVNTQSYDAAAIATFLQVADLYLIAHALAKGHKVVTHEVPSNSLKKMVRRRNLWVDFGDSVGYLGLRNR
jgi:hypothetical protein